MIGLKLIKSFRVLAILYLRY